MSGGEIERSDLAALDLDDVMRALDDAALTSLLGPDLRIFVWDARATSASWSEFVIGLGVADAAAPTEGALDELFARWTGDARVCGALAFERGGPAQTAGAMHGFVLPRVLLRATSRGVEMRVARSSSVDENADLEALATWCRDAAQRSQRAKRSQILEIADDGEQVFRGVVELALREIDAGRLEKVVVRRTVEMRGSASVADVLERLRGLPHTTRFAVSRDGAWFVGATPELLVSKRGHEVETEAVAGSLRRDPAQSVGAELRALSESAKDRWEHELVGRDIERVLTSAGVRMDIREAPRTRTLAHLHHLVTPMRGRAMKPTSALALALAMHPTPAMGGVPRERALAFIREHEAPRGLYASPIGWLERSGDGTFVVGIRSAVVNSTSVSLFAGVGVVKGSTVDAEVTETEAKLEAIRRSLGLGAGADSALDAAGRVRDGEAVGSA